MLKIFIAVYTFHLVQSSIDGISYINDISRRGEKYKKGEDPCNPLYWYPRSRPDYCDQKKDDLEPQPPAPIPLPVPVPVPSPPPQIPIGIPIAPSNPFIPFPGIPVPMPPPMPSPMFAPPYPMPMPMPMPMPYPMPYPQPFYPQPPMIGMVPGIPGLVSNDGGINIMPMSDVYADVLEKHRQRVIRKRLENALEEADGRRQGRRRSMSQQRDVRRHMSRPDRNLSE